MGSSEDKDCNMKHRNLPKLTPDNTDKETKAEKEPKEETTEERIARISKVEITFNDFFVKCIDHEMLKLFFSAFILFFFSVGIITCLYLIIIYFFQEKMWQFYFPKDGHHHSAHGEL